MPMFPRCSRSSRCLQEKDINRFNLITDMENKPVAAK